MRQLIGLIWPHRGRLGAAAMSGLAFAAGTGLLALAIGLVSDAVFADGGPSRILRHLEPLPGFLRLPLERVLADWRPGADSAALVWMILLVPVAMLLRGFGGYLTSYWTNWVAARAVHDLRVRLFSHIQALSLDFFHGARTGDLISRLSNDTQQLQQNIVNGISTVVRDPVTVVLLLSFLILRQPRLTAIALTVFPLVVVPVVIFGRKLRRSARATQTHASELNDVMQETFTAARVVKAYNLEAAVIGRFTATSRKIVSQFLRFIRASEFPGPLIEFFGSIGAALLLYYVARMTSGRPTQGDFNSFMTCLFALYQPLKNITRLYGHIEQARAVLERSSELLAARATVVDPVAPVPLDAHGKDVEFDHVEFRYGDHVVLNDFHFRIPAGKTIALVGPTGAGKTTVTGLLLRFMDPTRGAVRIGGVDLRTVAGSQIRDQIAVVSQETILFNDTIGANILLGRPGATPDEVREAARKAHAREFILARSEGFDAVVGEKGVTLSGGQRQRLALARAILRDAPILILDEATSALDNETERLVQEALEEYRRGRTTLCIAHRLSTVQSADWIVVMDAGRILEQGTHQELLARAGLYQRLHELQFRA